MPRTKETARVELERLLFEKNCSFFGECGLRLELEEERGRRVELEKNIEQYRNDFYKILHNVTETLALRHYADRLSSICEVEAIYWVRKEEALDIWTILSEGNLQIEEKIAGVQCELMRIYGDLEFDFMVVPRFETEVDEILPRNAIKVFPSEA